MEQSALQPLINMGAVGIMLIFAVMIIIWVGKRFIDYLEKQDERHIEERKEWLRAITDNKNALDKLVDMTANLTSTMGSMMSTIGSLTMEIKHLVESRNRHDG